VPAAPVAVPAPAADPGPSLEESALAEVQAAEAEYREAIRRLEAVVDRERPRWRPDVARAFDGNLAAIDAAIERQREAFRAAPGEVERLDGLHASYRARLEFLQETIVRAEVQR
jgi:hypothetical protein